MAFHISSSLSSSASNCSPLTNGAKSSRYTAEYTPRQKPLRQDRPLQVVVVGAGIGGIASAVIISKKVKNINLSVYDRNDKVGGTWASNVYPGVRCDVPSHVYQLNFAPNTEWSEYYPKGAEIQQYYERVIQKFGIAKDVHLEHEVQKAVWRPDTFQWEIEVLDLRSQRRFVQTAHFFVSSQGRISVPNFPDIPGLHDVFRGNVIHTARWRPDFEYENKRVAIIGNGASGQQLLPNIVDKVAHIDHYVRSKTWVTPTFIGDLHEASAAQPGGPEYTEEEKAKFREDPVAYLDHRRSFALKFHPSPGGDILGSPENQALRDKIVGCMLERLDGDEDWLARVLPDYAPGCKRLTPAPGYLEALKSKKVDYVAEKIIEVDETGIITEDGKRRDVDAIIAATGFQGGFTTLFPVIGKGGLDLREKWSPNGSIGYPETYLGVMAPGYPNYFTVLQAQGNARGGTVPLQAEISANFIAKCIRKIQTQGYVYLEPLEDAAQDFNDIVNGYFRNRVTSDRCNSWFKQEKGRSRMLLAWPGSYHHRADILRDPRWEDFSFGRSPSTEINRYDYFGDGSTESERTRESSYLTSYLKELEDRF